MITESLTRQFAREMRSRLITSNDLDKAVPYVVDYLGCYIAGGVTPQGQILRKYYTSGAFLQDSCLETDTFLSAALSHITETDDLHRSSVTHPACVVIPVALQLSRHLDLSGKMALEGVVIGYEAMIRMGEAVGAEHYKLFHNTATAGVFGAAAAAAYLLELTEDQWVWALGNAGTQAAGLWQFNADASMSKHLHAGHASQAGLKAALLAFHGFTGPEHILEGDKGFFRALCPDARPEMVTKSAYQKWRIGETSIKPYPSCRHTHPAIDATLALRDQLEREQVNLSQVTRIHVKTYDTALRVTDNPNPESTFAAKFSLQYCVTTALLHGFPLMPDFEGDRLSQTRHNPLLASVTVETDVAYNDRYPQAWGSSVALYLDEGRVLEQSVFEAKGDPEKPLSDDELRAKVLACFDYAGIDAAEAQFQKFLELKSAEELPVLYWNDMQKKVAVPPRGQAQS
jgi:2-methylcitrate dehydratase PrpD